MLPPVGGAGAGTTAVSKPIAFVTAPSAHGNRAGVCSDLLQSRDYVSSDHRKLLSLKVSRPRWTPIAAGPTGWPNAMSDIEAESACRGENAGVLRHIYLLVRPQES